MKKALVVFLILAVAGGLFAQVSGKVSTGVNFALTDDDIPVSAVEPVKAEVNFTGSGDDWGLKAGTSAKRLDGGTLTVGDLYGWVKFAGIFELSAGTGRGGWGTAGPWEKKVTDALGVKLAIDAMPGLNFGFRFGYAKDGVGPNKLANFFQETGIGATYSAGALSFAAGVNLDSEETNDNGLDASLYAGFKFTGIELVTISVDGGMDNVTEKSGAQLAYLGEKFNGSVAGIGWELSSKQKFSDPLSVTAAAKATYGIQISDPAKLSFEAGAGLTIMDEFNFDSVYAKANLDYKFNGNVSTGFELKVTDTMVKGADPAIASYLKWTIGYSF
jgi:hypothetical protein